MTLATLVLRKNEERRLLNGHVWIYSNEVDVVKTPLTNFTPGQQVNIATANDKIIGTGYVNPHSLICGRLFSRNKHQLLDKKLLSERIKHALNLRSALFQQPFYRLVYGESDNLPGLIIDRYGDTLVAQITTAGMEQLQDSLLSALEEILQPKAILLRNDTAIRTIEGLERLITPVYGQAAEYVEIQENDARFLVNIYEGQKTGWFYDHRNNRARLKDYVTNKRILDVFCYSGAWSIPAAKWGAKEIWCVDSSLQALNWLNENAALNQVQQKIQTFNKDAFEFLSFLYETNERFDLIVLDPPAFIKRRKDIKEGTIAYRRLNQLALRLLNPSGILITASCSLHLSQDDLLSIIRSTGCKGGGTTVQILEQGHQGPDHPIHPAIPETNYLKSFVLHKIAVD